MVVCNTFGNLRDTGTFLTFSQYMEDLTAWQSNDKYRKPVPSKFIAVDVPATELDNGQLPRYIQESFENGCACFKNSNDFIAHDDIDSMGVFTWDPEYSKTLFWNAMLSSDGLISIDDIKYIGDINLQSYNEVDGMGYSEIYCHIPDDAKVGIYTISSKKQIKPSLTIPKKIQSYLEGFDGSTDETKQLSRDYTYVIDNEYSIEKTSDSNEKSFNINMIIVLYDIMNDGRVERSDIPMGVYFPGSVYFPANTDKGNKGNIQNSITKYVSNEEAFGSGTSYGLRICSRFVVASECDGYKTPIVTCEDNNYGELTRVLSQMSISQQKMDQIVNKTYNDGQNYKDLLAIFKNQRVNVPYIKYINGEKYWFVNGRLVDSAESQLISLPNQPQMYIIASAVNENGEYIFKKGDKQKITVNAKVYENGLELNDVVFTGSNLGTYENVENTTEYDITATYNNRTAQAKTKVYFVNPTYYGCMDDLDLSNQYKSAAKIKEKIEEFKLSEKLYTSKEQIYEFTTMDSQYIVIVYPKTYGEASQIIDINNKYDVINSFDCLPECEIDEVNYIVYKSKEKIQLSNYTIQIK